MTQSPYDPTTSGPQFASTPPQYPGSAPGAAPSTQFPSAPRYPGPESDPSSEYPAQGYPTAPVGTYAPPTPPRKSSVLGIVGLGVVAVAAVIFFIASLAFFNPIVDALGPELSRYLAGGEIPTAANLPASVQRAIGGSTLAMVAASVVGIVGWVLSIVATAQNKGRVFGIIGIVVGFLAPLSIFLAAQIALSSYGF